jgi:hypothetical protein
MKILFLMLVATTASAQIQPYCPPNMPLGVPCPPPLNYIPPQPSGPGPGFSVGSQQIGPYAYLQVSGRRSVSDHFAQRPMPGEHVNRLSRVKHARDGGQRDAAGWPCCASWAQGCHGNTSTTRIW